MNHLINNDNYIATTDNKSSHINYDIKDNNDEIYTNTNSQNSEIFKRIKNKSNYMISFLSKLENNIEDIIKHKESTFENMFDNFQKDLDILSEEIDEVNLKSENLENKLGLLNDQIQLFSVNLNKLETEIKFVEECRSKMPKELEDLNYLLNTEVSALERLSDEEDRSFNDVKQVISNYTKLISLYKDFTQLDFKILLYKDYYFDNKYNNETRLLRIIVNNINQKYNNSNISNNDNNNTNSLDNKLILDIVFDSKVDVVGYSPKEINITEYYDKIDQANYDITLFIIYSVNKALDIYSSR